MQPLIFATAALLTLNPMVMARASDHLNWIGVSSDKGHFVRRGSNEHFIPWGVNYDHDRHGRLLEEYWLEEWEDVEEDFSEIRQLGANCVRIHLQVGAFMAAPDRADSEAVQQLKKLLTLAEEKCLYLNITGLGCYHRSSIPEWYDRLEESERWAVQARFWETVAEACRESPAVFCYDLMNEPILPGKDPETEWLAGEFAGKYFVQRIALDLNGRSRIKVASDWVQLMTSSIRRVDDRHLITVGVIPWVFVFGGGQPLFYSPEVAPYFDFVSIHLYPESDATAKAIESLSAYDIGKPLVIEETFPLRCSPAELTSFIHSSKSVVDGWFSFYWGQSPDELLTGTPSIASQITADWLKQFKAMAESMKQPPKSD
jgi:hypothetical protein